MVFRIYRPTDFQWILGWLQSHNQYRVYGCAKETLGLGGGGLNVKEKWCSFHVDKLLSPSALPDFFYLLVLVWWEVRILRVSSEITLVEPNGINLMSVVVLVNKNL